MYFNKNSECLINRACDEERNGLTPNNRHLRYARQLQIMRSEDLHNLLHKWRNCCTSCSSYSTSGVAPLVKIYAQQVAARKKQQNKFKIYG